MASKKIEQRVRMNDYVGPGIYAKVTWSRGCRNPSAPRAKDAGHFLGLLTHTCTRCGATPTSIEYERS